VVLTHFGALTNKQRLDDAAATIHASLAGADPDQADILRRAPKVIEVARDQDQARH
jgi:hypothetical protein